MNTFNLYATYYDLLYRDKNYRDEVDYINDLITLHGGKKPGKILEMGCGTGGHALYFAKSGHSVYGIDLSSQMIEKANDSLNKSSAEIAQRLQFEVGDLRFVRLQKKFDTVISLFHVMCYQTSNIDIAKAFQSVRFHLNPGGLFIFDFWYGPAVITDRPSVVNKNVEDDIIRVQRRTNPEIIINRNCVDVCFEVNIESKISGEKQKIVEHHLMRYFFLPEIEYYLSQFGLELINSYTWLKQDILGDNNWYGCVIAKAV